MVTSTTSFSTAYRATPATWWWSAHDLEVFCMSRHYLDPWHVRVPPYICHHLSYFVVLPIHVAFCMLWLHVTACDRVECEGVLEARVPQAKPWALHFCLRWSNTFASSWLAWQGVRGHTAAWLMRNMTSLRWEVYITLPGFHGMNVTLNQIAWWVWSAWQLTCLSLWWREIWVPLINMHIYIVY